MKIVNMTYAAKMERLLQFGSLADAEAAIPVDKANTATVIELDRGIWGIAILNTLAGILVAESYLCADGDFRAWGDL